jgi:hypothetical protein
MGAPRETKSHCCKCPCGQGAILDVCVEVNPNSTYGHDEWSYEMDCPSCKNEWEIVGKFLHKGAERIKIDSLPT